jgi:hypothetical protein
MNSPSASNGSFCGGNATDLQSKLPKTLSEQAKPRNDSDEGIYERYTIAFMLGVAFCAVTLDVTPRTKLSEFLARPQNALRFARESAQFVAHFHSFDSANTALWCLLCSG